MRTWYRLFHEAKGRAPARKYRSPATGNISGIYRLALTQVVVRKVGIYRGLVRNNSGHKDVGSSGYCAGPLYARHLNIDFTEAKCWRLRQERAGLCSWSYVQPLAAAAVNAGLCQRMPLGLGEFGFTCSSQV